MKKHLSRKSPCLPKYNFINLDDCKDYILQGYTYSQYSSEFNKVSNGFKPDGMEQKDTNWDISGSKKTQNGTDHAKSIESECKYCNKILSCQKSLRRHYKTCKEKKEDDAVKQSMSDLVKMLNEKDKELQKKNNQIDELIKKAGINNSTITQNIQNNIKLLNYGNTDISHLTDNDFIGCLKHKNFCIPYLIEKFILIRISLRIIIYIYQI